MDSRSGVKLDSDRRPPRWRGNIRRRLAGAGLAAVVLALAGCSGGGPSTSSSSSGITIAIASATLAPKEEVAIYAVGKQMGYFKDEGLKVDIITADGSTAAVQAVASGSADITASDAGSVLAGVAKGVPIKAVGGLVQNFPYRIGVQPDSPIRSADDLKGKKIGVISLSSGSAPFARQFLEAAGLSSTSDAKLLPVGVGAQAKGALDSGRVDALALYTQAYQLIENTGAKFRLLENPPVFDGVRSLTWTTTDDAISERSTEIGHFLRAAYKSLLFSATHPREAMQMGYKAIPQLLSGDDPQAHIDADTKTLRAWLETAVPTTGKPSTWDKWGNISEDSWQATENFAKAADQIDQTIPIDEVFTDKFLSTANDFDPQKVLNAHSSN